MSATIRTRPGAGNDSSVKAIPLHYRAARDFRALRLQVFGRGALAEHAAAEYLCCSTRTLARWETGKTMVPHGAVLALRERLREAVAA